MSETEREIEVVAGVIVGTITKKPDTWQVEVQPDGSQYTKKLWTKSSTLIAAVNAKIGQHGAFVCSASYWQGPNGQVRSLWINEEAEEGAVSTPRTTPEAAVALARVEASQKPQNRSYAPDLKDRMIVRQTALKAAAELWGPRGVEPDPVLEVIKAAQRFEAWVYRDIDEPPSEAGRPALSEHDQEIPY